MRPVAAAPARSPDSFARLRQTNRRRAARALGHQLQRETPAADCNRPRASARSNVAQRCLHGSPCGLKYGQVHEASSFEPRMPQPHPVFRGPAHLGDDLAGPGRHHGNPALDKIRLAPRPDRIAEIPRDFLGNPYHLFPLGTDPAIGAG